MLHNFPPPYVKKISGELKNGALSNSNFFILKSAQGVAGLIIKMNGDNLR